MTTKAELVARVARLEAEKIELGNTVTRLLVKNASLQRDLEGVRSANLFLVERYVTPTDPAAQTERPEDRS